MPKRRNFLKGLAASAAALSVGTVEASKGAPIREAKNLNLPTIDLSRLPQDVQRGDVSLDDAIRMLGDDPDEVRLQLAMDEIRQSPWYQEFVRKQVMAQLSPMYIYGGEADRSGIPPADILLNGKPYQLIAPERRFLWQEGFDLNDA